MAETVIVDGPCVIKVDTGSANALETLGRSEVGVDVTEQCFAYEVHGDDQGGDVGPPIDIQYMGEVHQVRATLTKYDEAILNKVRPRLYGGTAGTAGTPGTLWFADSKFYRLLLHSTNRPRNYLRAIWRDAFEVNKGTKHSKAVIVAHCYMNSSSVLYNSTTS